MPAPHPLLGPLGELIGDWEGEGTGRLPGEADFTWHERLTVATPGTPVVSFRQRTTRPDGSPFHAEDGWVRVPPELQVEGATSRSVELAVASPTGILEALSGALEVTDSGFHLDARSTSVSRTPAAGHVHDTRRRWTWDGHVLVIDFWMATRRNPEMFHHLTTRLHRAG